MVSIDKMFSVLEGAAAIAPALIDIFTVGDWTADGVRAKSRQVILDYTGSDIETGDWDLSRVKRGWGPAFGAGIAHMAYKALQALKRSLT